MQISIDHSMPVRRAVRWAFVIGAALAVVLAAAAAIVMVALDTAVPTGRLDAIAVLAALAGAAATTTVCLESVRRRVLLRSALWLSHFEGMRRLELHAAHASTGDELKDDLDALARLEDALATGAVAVITDLPGALLGLVIIAAIDPRAGALAAAAALVMAALAIVHARRTRGSHAKARGSSLAAAVNLAALTGTTTAHFTPAAESALSFDKHNQRRIAATYLAATTACTLRGAATLVACFTLAVAVAGMAWIWLAQAVSLGALAMVLVLMARALAVAHALVRAAPSIDAARAAWRHLAGDRDQAAGHAAARGFTIGELPGLRPLQSMPRAA